MAAKQFFLPHLTATVSGIAQPGARAYFYETGTLTPLSTYTTSALSIENSNPVVADASGAFPAIWLDNTQTYRVRLCDKNGTLLSGGEFDPFVPGVFPDASVLQPYQDAAEAAAVEAAASEAAAAASATAASDSEDNAASSATAAASSATAASSSASAASTSATAAADSATAAASSATAAATSASAADASADDAAASAAAAAAAVVPVPTGGLAGQVLSKASGTDFDTEWADSAGGLSNIIDVLDYGYVADYDGSTGTDNASAIAAAIAAAEAAATNAGYGSGSNYRGAPTIIFPAGWAYTSATIEPLCTLTLQGQGGIGTGASTRISFAVGIDGIRTQAYNTSGESSTRAGGQSGADIMLRGIRFEGGSLLGGADGNYHGLHLRAQCVAYDCSFIGFQGEGLYSIATATAGGAGEGNANCSKFFNCHFHLNRNGVLLNGADTNAFLFSGCHADGNRGWGFDDASFLGNTFVACHTASNTTGPYRTTNANATSVFIGCYSELGQPTSSFSNTTLVFGGQHGAGVSGGTYMNGGASNTQFYPSNDVLQVRGTGSTGYLQLTGASSVGTLSFGDGTYAISGGAGYNTYKNDTWGLHRFYGTSSANLVQIDDLGISLMSGKALYAGGVGTTMVINSSGVLQAAGFPALTGDVTTSAGSLATTIANDAVTYAKMQNVSATDKLLGRSTAGAGDVEEITCTAAGRALLDDADAAAQRATLGLVIGTDVQAYGVDKISASNVMGMSSSTAVATKGAILVPSANMTIYGAWFRVTEVNTATYKVGIYELNGSNVIQSVLGTVSATATASATTLRSYYFASPISLTSGTRYALAITRTDATSTTSVTIYGGNHDAAPAKLTVTDTYVQLASVNPAVSDTFTTGANAYYYGILYS